LLIYVAAIDGRTELLRKPVGEPDATENDGDTLSGRPSLGVGPSLDNLGISDGSCEMLGKLDGTRDSVFAVGIADCSTDSETTADGAGDDVGV
jgi:hypothetical protein